MGKQLTEQTWNCLSVAKDLPFAWQFGERASTSLGVALVLFLIGLAVKAFLGIDI